MSESSDEKETRKRDEALVQGVVDRLGEHFDTVQVFCTRHDAPRLDGTVHMAMGSGNWFARYGQVQAWVVTEEESHRDRGRT